VATSGTLTEDTTSAITGGGSLTTSGNTTLSGTNSYTGATTVAAGTLSISGGGTISGAGALTMDTGASLTVADSDTNFTGPVTVGSSVSSGTVTDLLVEATQALGTGNITITGNSDGAILQLNGSGISLNNPIQFDARTNATQVGIENVSGNNTLSGLITGVTGGSFYVVQSDSGTLSLTGGINLNHTLVVQGNGNGLISGVVADTGADTGGLTKSGTGTWTLSASNPYTGATTVNAGALIVSGSLTGSVATVNTGGTLEVDGSVTDSPVLSGGALQGTGTVPAFSSTSGDDSTVAPGLTIGSTAAGQLTASGNVTLNTGDTFSIRVGVAGPTDSDSLNIGANTLTLNGATLAVNTGAFASGATTDQLYDIVVGTGAGNTVGTFDFGGNPLANEAEFTTNTNYTYQIFYNVLGTDPTQAGSDDVLELVSVPEPSTWASLLGGLGLLIVWQRSRRRQS
jgi:autotransporter-associated beta strand protein